MSYRIDGHLVQVEVVGHFRARELVEQIQACLRDPRLQAESGLLLDVSASEVMAEGRRLKVVATMLGESAKLRSVAVVVEQPARFGMGRQFSVYLDEYGIRCRPFYDREDALSWLEI